MKTTNLILIIPLLIWSCVDNKSNTAKSELSDTKTTKSSLYAEEELPYIVSDMILRNYYQPDSALNKQPDTLLLERVESKEAIDLIPNKVEFEFGETYSIGKTNKIVADFNEDVKQDIIVQVRYEYGTSVGSDFGYLFLNTNDRYAFKNKIEISQIAKQQDQENTKNQFGMFVFEKTEDNLLVGKSYYFDKDDMPCCPTLYTTEKYKYNPENAVFERVYQSELKKKSYE